MVPGTAPVYKTALRGAPYASRIIQLYDIDDLVAILRSPDDASQVADLIDKSRALLDATAKTAHVSVQTEPATATVGTTMHSLVNVREKSSLATFSLTTQARMVSSEVQCSSSQPHTMQRAVQATPARVATRNAASGTISWHELKQKTLPDMRAIAREEVLEEFEPALERVVVAVEVQATCAAAKLEAARELKEAVRAGFESQAREAAAAAADRRAAAEDRKVAVRDRAHNEGVVELLRARLKGVKAVSKRCLSGA